MASIAIFTPNPRPSAKWDGGTEEDMCRGVGCTMAGRAESVRAPANPLRIGIKGRTEPGSQLVVVAYARGPCQGAGRRSGRGSEGGGGGKARRWSKERKEERKVTTSRGHLQRSVGHRSVGRAALPRPYRATLAQLRSRFCPALNSYLERVGRIPDALCPSCRGAPHTTSHIFSCPSLPTSLMVRDLWDHPCTVVEFLTSLPFLFMLPPLPRPPPQHPHPS